MKPISDTNELFRHQRAIRNFTDEDVPDELVVRQPEQATIAWGGICLQSAPHSMQSTHRMVKYRHNSAWD
jgi:hypothetical protein